MPESPKKIGQVKNVSKSRVLDSTRYLPGFNDHSPILKDDGTSYDIPVEGSLGLLALGYFGIMLWRDKKYKSGDLN